MDSLDVQQLSREKKQIEEDLQHIGNSFAQLHAAQSKFKECQRSVQARLDASGEQQDILVPLTNSLYVRGEISPDDQVLVDIGTGYLIQKHVKDAKDFYQSKVDDLTKTLREVETIVHQKTASIQAIDEVIRKKIIAATPQGS